MYNSILKKILFPVSNVVIGRKFWSMYESLQRSQWYSREKIEGMQLARLQRMVSYAYTHVPLYRERMDATGIRPDQIRHIGDLAKLPIVSKSDFKSGFPDRCTSHAVPRKDWLMDSTSGSTGKPFQFVRDKNFSDYSLANTFRAYTWTGMDIGDKNVSLWGYHERSTAVKILDQMIRKKMLSSFDVDRDFSLYYKFLKQYKPVMVEAYSASITQFAKLLKSHGLNDLRVPVTISSAETLYEENRKLIEETIHTNVFNRYGSREAGCVAQECTAHAGMHVNAESYVVEIVKKNVHDKTGRIVVTNLTNYVMPFIRYDTEDLGALRQGNCVCGRGLPLLESVEGRATDYIMLPDGQELSFLFFNYFFEQYGAYISQFQVIQDTASHLTINIVITDKYTGEQEKRLLTGISKKIGHDMVITLNKVDAIKPEASGKLRPIKRLI